MSTDLERALRHYARCERVFRACDVDGFLDWLGPDSTFTAADGSTVRHADTRPFWEWRFGLVVEVRRCEMTVERVVRDAGALLVVDFHERSDLTVRGPDGRPVERDADLHNRNWWRDDGARLTTVGGAELEARRTLDGAELLDQHDPWGLAAWRRHAVDRDG